MPIAILKYWKFAAVGILLLGAFMMGKRWEQAAYEKERADIAEATSIAIVAREAEIMRKHKIQVQLDADARGALQADLSALRTRERELVSEIDDLNLVKPIADLQIEGCAENEEGTQVVLANPFSVDFVRVWNESSSSPPTD